MSRTLRLQAVFTVADDADDAALCAGVRNFLAATEPMRGPFKAIESLDAVVVLPEDGKQ